MASWTCPKCKRTYGYKPAKCHYCAADAASAKRKAAAARRKPKKSR